MAGSRFAYLKGPLVRLELALVQWALDGCSRPKGFTPVVPPVLVREQALFGTRLPARHRAADLQRARRRAVPGRHQRGAAGLAARRRDPRAGRAAAALRRASRPASGARPAPPARTRRASSACTSSTRSRCSPSSSREESGRARAAAGDRGGDPAGARDPLPRGQHRGRRPRQLGRQEVRPGGVGCPGRSASASSPRARTPPHYQARRLDVRYRPRRARRRGPCTRSTAPPWRSAGRSSRSPRTTSATTARSRCPRCCTTSARRRRFDGGSSGPDAPAAPPDLLSTSQPLPTELAPRA